MSVVTRNLISSDQRSGVDIGRVGVKECDTMVLLMNVLLREKDGGMQNRR
jgi:hypothetical protein